MHISHFNNDNALTGVAMTGESPMLGGISEVWYDAHRPNVLSLLLLPALQNFGQQSRWMLWLTPEHKVDKRWLERSGIPLDKSIEITLSSQEESVQAMVKAIETGNYSVITACFTASLTVEQEALLDHVAKKMDTVVFILREKSMAQFSAVQQSGQKIPKFEFH